MKDIPGHGKGLGTNGVFQVFQRDLGVGEGHEAEADILQCHHMAHTG